MPPRGSSPSFSAATTVPDLWSGDARIDALPGPSFPTATVDALGELPDRRLFLKTLAFPCAAACAMALARNCFASSTGTWGTAGDDDSRYRVEARFYEKLPDKTIRCR